MVTRLRCATSGRCGGRTGGLLAKHLICEKQGCKGILSSVLATGYMSMSGGACLLYHRSLRGYWSSFCLSWSVRVIQASGASQLVEMFSVISDAFPQHFVLLR